MLCVLSLCRSPGRRCADTTGTGFGAVITSCSHLQLSAEVVLRANRGLLTITAAATGSQGTIGKSAAGQTSTELSDRLALSRSGPAKSKSRRACHLGHFPNKAVHLVILQCPAKSHPAAATSPSNLSQPQRNTMQDCTRHALRAVACRKPR